MRFTLALVTVFLCQTVCATSTPLPDSVYVRIIDVGPAHAAVMRLPGDFYVVFDAGNWQSSGKVAITGIRDVVPADEDIDLLVLSHSDADHLGAVDRIFGDYDVLRVIRSGLPRTTATWERADTTITNAADEGRTIDVNLSRCELPPGATYFFGETSVTILSAFSTPPSDWAIINISEERNAGSIVVRVAYRGHSILFTGDAVGRHIGMPSNVPPIATEHFIIENSDVLDIQSDVLIAPHHGADNGSSLQFVEAVQPTWIVIPAGSKYEHPRTATAQRYLDSGIALENIFRTDLGDDEGGDEWDHGRIDGNKDPAGDDDVEIWLPGTGEVVVRYRPDQ